MRAGQWRPALSKLELTLADTENREGRPIATIVIGTPSGGHAFDEYVQSLFAMQFGAAGQRYHLIPVQCQGSAIAHNQNNIVKGAREASAMLKASAYARYIAAGVSEDDARAKAETHGVDAIFFYENDEAFTDPESVIDRLWKSGKDIIGATYCYKDKARIRAMGVEIDAKPIDWLSLYHREPVSEVLALPSGALFVRMGVFDTLDAEEFTALSHEGQTMTITGAPHFQHDIHFGLKLVRTTDYVFCSRAAKAGYKIWLDAQLSLEIEHWGKYPYAFPRIDRINRQVATLQTIADDLAQSSESDTAPPEQAAMHKAMAEDLYAVVADIVRKRGVFADPKAQAEEIPV